MKAKLFISLLPILLILLNLIGLWQTNNIRHYSGMFDIRNRVVGSRLMHDGTSPYFYNWYPGDPLKYVICLDVKDSKERRASPCTASPFFHSVFAPFAFYDQADIEFGFFIFMYLLLGIMALIAWKESKNLQLTMLFFTPFLFTDGWQMHIIEGQYYLLFGFMLFSISYGLFYKKNILAGCLLGILVLLRLNTLLFCLPFFLLFRSYKSFLSSFAITILLYGLFVLSSPFQQKNWKEYFEIIKVNTERHLAPYHQDEVRTTSWVNMDSIMPSVFEGKDISPEKRLEYNTVEKAINSESSNLFLPIKNIIHKTPSNAFLQIVLSISILGLIVSLLMKKQQWNNGIPIEPLLFSGLLLYELSCFMAPIVTIPYQMTQWMAAGVFVIAFNKKIPRWLIYFFLSGIIINMAYFPAFRGKHVLGDIIFITATYLIVMMGKWNDATKQKY